VLFRSEKRKLATTKERRVNPYAQDSSVTMEMHSCESSAFGTYYTTGLILNPAVSRRAARYKADNYGGLERRAMSTVRVTHKVADMMYLNARQSTSL
jgi:hypothetical protein